MFEGTDSRAREYYRYKLVVVGGLVEEKRWDKSCFAPVMRHGKTAKDHATGSHDRRLVNHDTRKAWDKETTAKGGPKGRRHFPIEVCNGRESRALARRHNCDRPAIPGQKGGGKCRHKRGKKA